MNEIVTLSAITSDEEIHFNYSKINPIFDSDISLTVLIEKQKIFKKDLELLQHVEDLKKIQTKMLKNSILIYLKLQMKVKYQFFALNIMKKGIMVVATSIVLIQYLN